MFWWDVVVDGFFSDESSESCRPPCSLCRIQQEICCSSPKKRPFPRGNPKEKKSKWSWKACVSRSGKFDLMHSSIAFSLILVLVTVTVLFFLGKDITLNISKADNSNKSYLFYVFVAGTRHPSYFPTETPNGFVWKTPLAAADRFIKILLSHGFS